jgi:hypothetical protein
MNCQFIFFICLVRDYILQLFKYVMLIARYIFIKRTTTESSSGPTILQHWEGKISHHNSGASVGASYLFIYSFLVISHSNSHLYQTNINMFKRMFNVVILC